MDYSCREFLIRKFDEKRNEDRPFPKNRKQFEYEQKNDRAKLREIMGFDALGKYEIKCSTEEIFSRDALIIKRAILSCAEGLYMPMYILEPSRGRNSIPVIAVHGHGSQGKEGLVFKGPDDGLRFNYTYAKEMAQRGHTVFVPDLCGSGERMEDISAERGFSSSCTDINNAAISMGFSLQTIIIFELMGLIDYINWLGLNSEKLIVIGFSGGGLSGLLLSALDERVKLSYISGSFHGFKDTILYNNLCGCNFMPGLWKYFDMGRLASLVCPRALIIEFGTKDPLSGPRGVGNVLEQLDTLKKAYSLMDSKELYVFAENGAHRFYGAGYDTIESWCRK